MRFSDLFYIHLYCRKYITNFQKFGRLKRKLALFYLDFLLVHKEELDRGGSIEQGSGIGGLGKGRGRQGVRTVRLELRRGGSTGHGSGEQGAVAKLWLSVAS
jgi:hypothetical protein